MPVNKQIGNLWFDTQEEIDRYDDLMVSNIELKEKDNSDDPNYTYICPRSKKEHMPYEMSEKYRKGIEQYNNTKLDPKEPEFSHKYYHELPLFKYLTGTVFGYLVIRELPIRSFWARSCIMAFYLGGLRDNFQYRGLGGPIFSNVSVQFHPDYM